MQHGSIEYLLSLMDINACHLSEDYVSNKGQFHLHTLTTEQRHPKTWNLSQTAAMNTPKALYQLLSVDEDLTARLKELSIDESFETTMASAVDSVKEAFMSVFSGHELQEPPRRRVFFYGCGATGRLAKLMESALWRPFCDKLASKNHSKFPFEICQSLKKVVIGEMTGGDRALISSLEGLEDLQLVGDLQLRQDHKFKAEDVLFAVTEGGETSSVIGAVKAAAEIFELAGKTVEECKQNLFFVYNNPEIQLTRLIRSKSIFDDARISKIPLCTGPQAVTGSTRMQSTTIETFVLGLILENAAREMINEVLGHKEAAKLLTKLDFPSSSERPFSTEWQSFEKIRRSVKDQIDTISRLTDLESAAYATQKKAIYIADELTLLTVFTDCTERSPTFRLHPLDTVHDKIGKSWIKIKTPSSDAASAWETLLRRPFHGLEPSIYQTPFEEQVGDEVLRKAALASLAKAGDAQQELYNFAFSNEDKVPHDNVLILVTLNPDILDFVSQINLPKEYGLISVNATQTSQVASSVTLVNIEHKLFDLDPLTFRRNVAIKMLLNAHSTAIMAKNGRLVGNTMTSVSPSNLKLIGRATNLIRMHVNEALSPIRLAISYEQANVVLMDSVAFCRAKAISNDSMGEVALSIVRILASIQCKLVQVEEANPSWDDALILLQVKGLNAGDYVALGDDTTLSLRKFLDRELLLGHVDNREAKLDFKINCDVNIEDQVIHHFSKRLTIVVHDDDDNDPFLQGENLIISLEHNHLRKGEELNVTQNVLFDADLPASNEYEIELPDDEDSFVSVSQKHLSKIPFQCNATSTWCPCSHTSFSRASGKCIFNGTILYIKDSKLRVKRDIQMTKEVRIPVKLRNTRGRRETTYTTLIVKPSFVMDFNPAVQDPTVYPSYDYKTVSSARATSKRDVSNEENHMHFKDPEVVKVRSFHISVPTSATKYTRLFDTNSLSSNAQLSLRILSIQWQVKGGNLTASKLDETPLGLTRDESILYLNSPELMGKLNRSSVLHIEAKAKLLPRLSSSAMDLVIKLDVTFLPQGSSSRRNCETKNEAYACSEFSIVEECEAVCGFGTTNGLGKCQWLSENRDQGQTYSTCTNNAKTCPDKICDSLEQLDISICPQDCMPKNQIPMSALFMRNDPGWRYGFGHVLRSSMICTCQGSSCSCISKAMAHSVLEDNLIDYQDDSTSTKQDGFNNLPKIVSKSSNEASLCERNCIIGITVPVVWTMVIIGIVLLRKRLSNGCHKVFGRKAAVLNDSHFNATSMTSLSSDEHILEGRNGRRGHRQHHHRPVIRHYSGTSSTFTFGPSSLSTVSTNLSSTHQLNNMHEMRPFSESRTVMDHNNSYGDLSEPLYYHEVDKKWEFPRKNLIFETTIGEGEFGKVMSARAIDRTSPSGYKRVAVKMLKSNHRKEEVHDLLAEFNLLKEVNHPNVIVVFGACTSKGGPVCIIMEFAQHGSLRDYLRQSRGIVRPQPGISEYVKEIEVLSPKDIISFAWQVAKGMSYLSNMKLVHRDLAARNVLLSENMVCKVSDFGLTRDVYIDDAYWKKSNGRIPVKWLAPESLRDHLYTTKSDVWSYGVLLWELVTLGNSPYPGLQPERLLHVLGMGYRMQRPENCSEELYNLMTRCWQYCPDRRPTFPDLVSWSELLLQNSTQYLDLSPSIVNNATYLQPIQTASLLASKEYESDCQNSKSFETPEEKRLTHLKLLTRVRKKRLQKQLEDCEENDADIDDDTCSEEDPILASSILESFTDEETKVI